MARVLIVDGDPSIARSVRQSVSPWRVDVDAAYSVQHALDQLGVVGYDAVVLDLQMGHRSGLDVLDAMRADKIATRVVVTLSRVPDYARMLLLPSQVLTVVKKPLDIEMMAAIVLALCGFDADKGFPVHGSQFADEVATD